MCSVLCSVARSSGNINFPTATNLHTCDKSEVCQKFLQSHIQHPCHVHDDLFTRLSKSALEGLDAANRATQEKLEHVTDKDVRRELGEQLLRDFMTILNRPGSMLGKSFCT